MMTTTCASFASLPPPPSSTSPTVVRAAMKSHEDLRSLCRLCHDAVTMIEYGLGMGLDRINPEDPQWRDRIIEKRDEIIKFRSLETRRRRSGCRGGGIDMYLSCLLIDVGDNPDRPRPGRLWLRNLYHVHQRLCMAFPSARKTRTSDNDKRLPEATSLPMTLARAKSM